MTQQTLWLIEAALLTQDATLELSSHELLNETQVGDYIALKSVYVDGAALSHNLVMQIEKLGIIQSKNSLQIQTHWQADFKSKIWRYYVNRAAVWQLKTTDWMNQALSDYILHDQAQDQKAFIQSEYWQKQQPLDARFAWTEFYQAVARALLRYQQQRQALVDCVLQLAERYQLSYLMGKGVQDICPFTVMGMFNRGISSQKRRAIAQDLADFLEIKIAAPDNFDGIPVLNNQSSCFFAAAKANYTQDITRLWQFFATALNYAEQPTNQLAQQFTQQYDQVSQQHAVGWNLSMGLFWLAPYQFMSLDSQSQQYIQQDLQFKIAKQGAKGRCSGQDYLELLFNVAHFFQKPYSLPRNFPELALYAWEQLGGLKSLANDNDEDLSEVALGLQDLPIQSYTLNQLMQDGCFLTLEQVTQLQQHVLNKKNLILQGASGTGKTWLAKRLAYAVVGHKAQGHVYVMQFHANTSYEDFIRGWRPLANPSGQHDLQLVDGPFLQLIQKALQYPNDRFVMVIEEINRGQTAQIFGEMLTLLESSKRHPQEALSLTYAKVQEKIYIPDNLYVIATMNSADRSLNALDFALRRRFAFATLMPNFNQSWFDHALQQGVSHGLLQHIQDNMQALNQEIAENAYLGKGLLLGHSYFTPRAPLHDEKAWYQDIIESEILPLLEEYYQDDAAQLEEWQARLLDDWA